MLDVFIALVIVLIIGVGINIAEDYRKYAKFSFKETMDLLNVPIISFMCNDKKLHFLLDSGSSYSHVSPDVASSVHTRTFGMETVKTIGAGGNLVNSKFCQLNLCYKDSIFKANFIVTDQIVKQLESIKNDFNITIHGIIGGDFLSKYGYIIDFKDYVAYSKKKK